MPYECREIDGQHRLVNKEDGQVATTDDGEPRDGGGHASPEECARQAKTINNREYNSPQNNPSAAKRYRNPR